MMCQLRFLATFIASTALLISGTFLSTSCQSPESRTSVYVPCALKACGDTCTLCAPTDGDCVETDEAKACNENRQCVAEATLTCDDSQPYAPCADKPCGESCQECDPAASDCTETSEDKACNLDGECVSSTEAICEEPPPYEPCGGKSCGDMCTLCDPADPDCAEDAVIKACNPEGQCVADTGNLCDETTYDPCAGKNCGDMCTICDPADPDCVETMEIKACNPDGQCVSDTGDLCDDTGDCQTSVLPDNDFMADLPWDGGCGDLVLYAMKTDGTFEVTLWISGVCEAAHEAGTTINLNYTLPDSEVQLNLRMGTNVSDATCDDVLEAPMNVVHEFPASAGTITLAATPEGEPQPWSSPARVTVTLSNIEFQDENQCTTTVSSYTWENVYVGWFPG